MESPTNSSPPAMAAASPWLLRIADLANLTTAWEKVRHNGGAPGVDGINVAAFERVVSKELPILKKALIEGSYQPRPVRAVDIPKPSGGLRTLGIPTVADRVVQQAISQVLTPVWDVLFSPSSHAYRRGHDALDAVAQVQQHLTSGKEWIVDLDIEKFFDHIHHDRLLDEIRAQVSDEAVLAIIRRFLEAGVARSGYRLPTTEGTPQGSPLSPLLANIVLNSFDQQLDARGQCFARYADDAVILCTTEQEAHQELDNARSFLRDHLQLRLNENKTRICTPPEVTFLGFAFQRDATMAWRRAISDASMEAFRAQVDQITARDDHATDIEAVLHELASYVHGWENYYRHPETAVAVKRLRAHARTSVRRLLWRLWGTPERRTQELVRRGISPDAAHTFVISCADAATAATSPVLGNAVPNAFFATYGLSPESAAAAVPYGPSESSISNPRPACRKTVVTSKTSVAAASSSISSLQPGGSLPPGSVGLHLGLCIGLGNFGSLRGAIDLHLPFKKGETR